MGLTVVKGGQNLNPLVGIGLTDLPNIEGAPCPPPFPASLILKVGLELNGNRKLTYSKDLMKNSATVLTTDYGHLMRKSPSLHSRKSTPNPKFLGTAEAYFVCHVGPNFQIFFDICLHWVSVVRGLLHETFSQFVNHCKYVFLFRKILFHSHVFFHVFLCFHDIKN